jgi:hypothetical protein
LLSAAENTLSLALKALKAHSRLSPNVPINGPAIGDLRTVFNFGKFRPNAPAIKPIVSDQDQDDQGDPGSQVHRVDLTTER